MAGQHVSRYYRMPDYQLLHYPYFSNMLFTIVVSELVLQKKKKKKNDIELLCIRPSLVT